MRHYYCVVHCNCVSPRESVRRTTCVTRKNEESATYPPSSCRITGSTVPRSYCTRDDSPMLGASLQLMSEPGSSSCREGWTSWKMGRTKASSGLSTEEYGMILRHFEEHGPQKVEEEMRIPHKEDKLPREPVLGNPNHSPPCCIHYVSQNGCIALCPNRVCTTRICCTLSGSPAISCTTLCVLYIRAVSL